MIIGPLKAIDSAVEDCINSVATKRQRVQAVQIVQAVQDDQKSRCGITNEKETIGPSLFSDTTLSRCYVLYGYRTKERHVMNRGRARQATFLGDQPWLRGGGGRRTHIYSYN